MCGDAEPKKLTAIPLLNSTIKLRINVLPGDILQQTIAATICRLTITWKNFFRRALANASREKKYLRK